MLLLAPSVVAARGLRLATIAATGIRVDWSLWFVSALVAIVQRGTLVGVVGMAKLRELPDVGDAKVGTIMTPATRVVTMAPEELVTEALALMNREHVNQVPVVVDGRVRGQVRQRDVWKWLALQRPQAA